MDFGLSEEQTLFRESVSRYLSEAYPFETRQKVVAGEDGYRAEDWAQFAELGWLAAPFPEAVGGLDGGAVETAVIMEQFGRHLLASPFLATVVLGGRAVLEGGSDQQKDALLSGVTTGETRLAFAFEEPDGWQDPAYVTTRAQSSGDGYVLDGVKANVAYADAADHMVVTARTSGEPLDRDGISVFVVPADADGLTIKSYVTQDGGRAGDVSLSGVAIGKDALLGAEGQGLSIVETALDWACATACAEAVGAMWSVHEQTLEYMKTREQFGSKLGSFQALQHRMVDMYMACELAQSITMDTIAALDRGQRHEARQAVSAAKAHVSRSARKVGQEGIQLHGGIGMTMDLPIGHYFKRLMAISMSFGDAAHHRRRYLEDQMAAN